mmetsp:Transcript_17209/g.34810  ORF Transcript_17209/g.34810 Transcript_17209/m.34810 type:complete len:225 (+) Transcript_17209:568-1242(+)
MFAPRLPALPLPPNAAGAEPSPPPTPGALDPPPPPPLPPPRGRAIPTPEEGGGIRRAIASTSRSVGMPCSQTVPGPVSVVRKRPSPPKTTFLKPLTICTSKSIDCSKATSAPLDTRSTSPGTSSRRTSAPPALTRAVPPPTRRWSTKPSPPKKPAPNDLVKAISIVTSGVPQRKAPFWQMTPPPWSLSSRGTILLGISVPNATCDRPDGARLIKSVMKRLSPVM